VPKAAFVKESAAEKPTRYVFGFTQAVAAEESIIEVAGNKRSENL